MRRNTRRVLGQDPITQHKDVSIHAVKRIAVRVVEVAGLGDQLLARRVNRIRRRRVVLDDAEGPHREGQSARQLLRQLAQLVDVGLHGLLGDHIDLGQVAFLVAGDALDRPEPPAPGPLNLVERRPVHTTQKQARSREKLR